jgi:hypothetical protein
MKKIAKIGKESLIVLFLLIISLSISGIGTRAFGLNQAESPNYQANIIIDQTIGGSYLDYAYSVINTSDGGFALAGYTYSDGAGSSDMWLVKTDDTGQVEWEQNYGGTKSDYGFSIIATIDGGYVLGGGTESYGAENTDMWLVKTDNQGEIEWNHTYGGINEDRATAVLMASDRGYVITGLTQSFGAGNRDMWLVKTDSSGQPEWNQTFGGKENDLADSLIATTNGGYALAGRTESFGAGSEDMWLVKTNSSGQMEWNQAFGGSEEDAAYSVIEIAMNEYVLVGRTTSQGIWDADLWLLKVKMVSNIPKTSNLPIFDLIFFFVIVLAIFNKNKRKNLP